MMLDTRLNAYRNDLADVRLKGLVDSKSFCNGTAMQLIVPIATLHRAPKPDAPQETQVLLGETVSVFDVNDDWAWVQLERDGYVGYVQAEFLNAEMHRPSHRISVTSTLLYRSASIKTQPVQFLFMNSEISVVGLQDGFFELATGGFIFAAHAVPISQFQTDFVGVAELLLHTPYLWGGKSAQGIDCSGLVQTSLNACGQNCLRDADMQELSLGQNLMINDLESLKRGDLIFWKGHVGIMRDAETLLHASGHQMMVVSEPLRTADDRTKAKGKAITSIKRLA